MVVDFDHDLDPTVLAEQAVQVLERILDTVISEENKLYVLSALDPRFPIA